MDYLHLDEAFCAALQPAVAYTAHRFPGGEPHIKLQVPGYQKGAELTITTRLKDSEAVISLLLATDAARRAGWERIHAVLPYFPAARQDRVMVPGEPLSVKVYANLINAQNFASVTVFDPHSEVTPALLDRVHSVPNHDYAAACLQHIPAPYSLVSPDGGALKKIDKLAAFLGGADVVECSKRRDVSTGALTDFIVYSEELRGRTCVVVDDICDGGGTFLGLAKALRARGAGTLYLIVSHGIFSKGVDALAEAYERIFTTDSVREIEHPRGMQMQLAPFLFPTAA